MNNKRWGASLSGPIYIPKIYNGKDKAFFTYGYEGVHRAENNTTTATVPTAKQLTGDFSDLLMLGAQYQIYDPETITPAANGRFSIRPFEVFRGRLSTVQPSAGHNCSNLIQPSRESRCKLTRATPGSTPCRPDLRGD